MRLSKTPRVRFGATLLALIVAQAPITHAQSAPGVAQSTANPETETVTLDKFVVTGVRASLKSALEQKRDKIEITDSIVSDDVNKLPDLNVTEALQRISGIQITRDRGEGGTVAIRGLTQMETLLNGREVFTAGGGRGLNFQDVAAELISGIDVYKTSSAHQIEGGLGGTVDVRTRRPFDFPGLEVAGSARLVQSDLVDSTKPQFSVLASDRFKTSAGEIGALVNLTYQERAWREDNVSIGNPVSRTDLISGQTVAAPNGVYYNTSAGSRKRTGVSAVVQWRPSADLELYAEANYAKFKTIQDTYGLSIGTSTTPVAGSASLFSGTNDVKAVSYTNVPFTVLAFARDTEDKNQQFAVGGKWIHDALTLRADLSYTDSSNTLWFNGINTTSTAPSFTQNLASHPAGNTISGVDLSSPSAYNYTTVAYRVLPFDGDLKAAKLDADYALKNEFLRSIQAGLRFARRGASNAPGLIFGDVGLTNRPVSANPALTRPIPWTDFFPHDQGTPMFRNYLVGNLQSARNPQLLRDSFNITTPLPTTGNPLSVWDINEDTASAHVMANYKFIAGLPIDGNAGIRYVETKENVSGHQSVPATGAVAPIDIHTRYHDVLPSFNGRITLMEGLYLRLAASKTLTRPDFSQLSPSLTLIPNPTNPLQNTGGAGNPALKPIRGKNYDLSLEKYFSETGSVYVAVFHKRVEGFPTTVSSPETYDGVTYQVSRPQNGAGAKIKGYEVGYQQFFDFLPGALKGFGAQLNYTYVDSETPSSVAGLTTPLQNLSKNSYNVVLMYEQKKLTARVAYNWRDKFFTGISNIVGIGPIPNYNKSYGWLDASVSYQITDKVRFALEGSNLTRTMRETYYGVETRPSNSWINDLQVMATVTVRL